jgi:hypothetical protein
VSPLKTCYSHIPSKIAAVSDAQIPNSNRLVPCSTRTGTRASPLAGVNCQWCLCSSRPDARWSKLRYEIGHWSEVYIQIHLVSSDGIGTDHSNSQACNYETDRMFREQRLLSRIWIKHLKVRFSSCLFITMLIVFSAARAYRQALLALSTLTAHTPSHTSDPSFGSYSTPSKSFWLSILPNLQGQGPLGSFMRIILKLHQQSWLPRIMSGFGLGKQGLGAGASKKREEEIRGRGIKVLDLLHHSSELGNLDALYTLAQISLVR